MDREKTMTCDNLPKRHSILCVDDDVIGLEARAALLESNGYCVTSIGCPLVALEQDLSRFHLAVIDFDMPVLNGLQLLLRLRIARAPFPIVLLSGMVGSLSEDTRSLFSRCIDKGAPMCQLLDTIRFFLTAAPDPPECRASDGEVARIKECNWP